MTRKTIFLRKYEWQIDFYLSARREDVPVLLNELRMMGASDEALSRCACSLGCLNTGLAYTNPRGRHSLAVIAHAIDAAEFFDTFVHELNHVCIAIEDEYGIDPRSEEASYLIGDVTRAIVRSVC